MGKHSAREEFAQVAGWVGRLADIHVDSATEHRGNHDTVVEHLKTIGDHLKVLVEKVTHHETTLAGIEKALFDEEPEVEERAAKAAEEVELKLSSARDFLRQVDQIAVDVVKAAEKSAINPGAVRPTSAGGVVGGLAGAPGTVVVHP
jgi:hypothetical protein